MRYVKKKYRAEIIESFNKAIDSLENNIYNELMFLCYRINSVKALTLFKEEQPTANKHGEFFKSEFYSGGHAWWYYKSDSNGKSRAREVNSEKIRFLKHLIKLIENQK